MSTLTYYAVLTEEPDGSLRVTFPDVPGCTTKGADVPECQRLAGEVLTYYVEGLLENGRPLPEPSDFQTITDDPRFEDTLTIEVSIDKPKA